MSQQVFADERTYICDPNKMVTAKAEHKWVLIDRLNSSKITLRLETIYSTEDFSTKEKRTFEVFKLYDIMKGESLSMSNAGFEDQPIGSITIEHKNTGGNSILPMKVTGALSGGDGGTFFISPALRGLSPRLVFLPGFEILQILPDAEKIGGQIKCERQLEVP